MGETGRADSIVVGVDGSTGSHAAVGWAVAEARMRAAPLRVVHAWRLPLPLAAPEPAALGAPLLPELSLEELREASMAKASALVDKALAGVETSGVAERVIVEAPPARALLDAAGGAALLVVGSRGRGGFAGLLLGSVSQQCAHHAPCPIVIVPKNEVV